MSTYLGRLGIHKSEGRLRELEIITSNYKGVPPVLRPDDVNAQLDKIPAQLWNQVVEAVKCAK